MWTPFETLLLWLLLKYCALSLRVPIYKWRCDRCQASRRHLGLLLCQLLSLAAIRVSPLWVEGSRLSRTLTFVTVRTAAHLHCWNHRGWLAHLICPKSTAGDNHTVTNNGFCRHVMDPNNINIVSTVFYHHTVLCSTCVSAFSFWLCH